MKKDNGFVIVTFITAAVFALLAFRCGYNFYENHSTMNIVASVMFGLIAVFLTTLGLEELRHD